MPTLPRRPVLCLLLIAACTATPATFEGDQALDHPDGAALWQLERYLDENGRIPDRAWQTALQSRQATVAATAATDAGGIGPLAWTQRGPDRRRDD